MSDQRKRRLGTPAPPSPHKRSPTCRKCNREFTPWPNRIGGFRDVCKDCLGKVGPTSKVGDGIRSLAPPSPHKRSQTCRKCDQEFTPGPDHVGFINICVSCFGTVDPTHKQGDGMVVYEEPVEHERVILVPGFSVFRGGGGGKKRKRNRQTRPAKPLR